MKYGDFDFVKLSNVPFVETKLPYSECVPSNDLLDEYGLNGAQLCLDNVERRVDMILGSSDLRKFKEFETCVWKNSLNDPLLGTHPLRTIIWGQKVDTTSQHHVFAMSTASRTYYLEQIVDIVSAEHNISSDKCLELLPLLESDLRRYYKHQLVLEPDHAEMIWSKEDEKVLEFFEENIEEIVDEKEVKRLQLPLPWKEGFPVSPPKSYRVAKLRLTAQRKRLSNHSDRLLRSPTHTHVVSAIGKNTDPI